MILFFFKEKVSMVKQYGTFLLMIMTCVAAPFFVVREYYTWWNLSLCEMEKCDGKFISITMSFIFIFFSIHEVHS